MWRAAEESVEGPRIGAMLNYWPHQVCGYGW